MRRHRQLAAPGEKYKNWRSAAAEVLPHYVTEGFFLHTKSHLGLPWFHQFGNVRIIKVYCLERAHIQYMCHRSAVPTFRVRYPTGVGDTIGIGPESRYWTAWYQYQYRFLEISSISIDFWKFLVSAKLNVTHLLRSSRPLLPRGPRRMKH